MRRTAQVLVVFVMSVMAVAAGWGRACAQESTALQSRDLWAPGDGFLTYDPITKLEWLDLNLTKGLIGTDVLTGVGGWTERGFRYPIDAELADLFVHAGLRSPDAGWTLNDGWVPELYEPARAFVELFGATGAQIVEGVYAQPAYYSQGMSISYVLFAEDIAFPEGAQNAGFLRFMQGYGGWGSPVNGLGHWLVRDTRLTVDVDADGIPDQFDTCPNTTTGAAVDPSGCSAVQFCGAVDATTSTGARICTALDWKNDEPVMSGKDADCRVTGRGTAARCVPAAQ